MKPRILIVLTLVAVSLACLVLLSIDKEQSVGEVADYGMVFPKLIDELNEVASIGITTFEHNFQIIKLNERWQISALSNYPANHQVVSSFLIGLAQLRKLAPKTSEPKKHELLHLAGTGVKDSPTIKVDLWASDNRSLGSLLIGKSRSSVRNVLLTEFHVRQPDDDQTWLAESGLSVPASTMDWLDATLIDLDERIHRVSIESPDRATITVERDADNGENFSLVQMPEQHKIRYQFRLNDIAEFFRRLKFEDVRPASDQPTGIKVTANVVDHLEVSATFGIGELSQYARFEAIPTAGALAAIIDEAKQLNQKWAGWMYRISDVRRATAELTIADLIEPITGSDTN